MVRIPGSNKNSQKSLVYHTCFEYAIFQSFSVSISFHLSNAADVVRSSPWLWNV